MYNFLLQTNVHSVNEVSLKMRNAGQQLMMIILGFCIGGVFWGFFWLCFVFWRPDRRKLVLSCLHAKCILLPKNSISKIAASKFTLLRGQNHFLHPELMN